MKKLRFFNSDLERKPEKLKPANSKREETPEAPVAESSATDNTEDTNA